MSPIRGIYPQLRKSGRISHGGVILEGMPCWPGRFSGQTFRLDAGDDRHSPKILREAEAAREGAEVLDVPEELRTDFVRDMEGSLRDFAGRTTTSAHPYIRDRARIAAMFDRFHASWQTPYDVVETDLVGGVPELVPGYEVPNPAAPRVAHVDLGLTGDACGLAVGHANGYRMVRKSRRREPSRGRNARWRSGTWVSSSSRIARTDHAKIPAFQK